MKHITFLSCAAAIFLVSCVTSKDIAPGIPLPKNYEQALTALKANGYQVIEADPSSHITALKGDAKLTDKGTLVVTDHVSTYGFTNGTFNGSVRAQTVPTEAKLELKRKPNGEVGIEALP